MSPRGVRGLLGIEYAAARYRWVTPLLCVGFVALVILAFSEAVAAR